MYEAKIQSETAMRQPSAAAFFTCSHCDAAYDSDALLQGHKITAHRGSGAGQRSSQQVSTPGENSESHTSEHQNQSDRERDGPIMS
jgi:hypothetical protein